MSVTATANTDTYGYAPGAAQDAGLFTGFSVGAGGFAFTPVEFSGITGFLGPGVGSTAADTVIINGTSADDTFRASESATFPGFFSWAVNSHTEIFAEFSVIVSR